MGIARRSDLICQAVLRSGSAENIDKIGTTRAAEVNSGLSGAGGGLTCAGARAPGAGCPALAIGGMHCPAWGILMRSMDFYDIKFHKIIL
jgi:hypothetical protein